MSIRKLRIWNADGGNLFHDEELGVIHRSSFRERTKIGEGMVSLYKYPGDDDGSPIREKGECLFCCFDNLIVNTGRAALAALQRHTIDGATAGGTLDLGYLGVGVGSVGGATVPLPGDTSMATESTDPVGGPVVSGVPRPTLSVATPPPGPPYMTNLWTGQIGTADLNGLSIDEAALWCLDDSTMFAYRTFGAQAKTSGFVLEFRWSIIF
jgi:hypothetical protein